MFKRFGLLFITVIVLTALFITSCKEESSDSTPPTQVQISVKIAEGLRHVVRGGSLELIAVVNASDGKPGGVTWEVTGSTAGAYIVPDSADEYKAVLYVPLEEGADALFVTVISKRDTKKDDFIAITVGNTEQPKITGITLTPNEASVYKDDEMLKFGYKVLGDEGVSQEVTWKVEGSVCNAESCDRIGVVIIEDGCFLFICEHEESHEIIVIVTSVVDTSMSAQSVITINTANVVYHVEIVLQGGDSKDNISVLKGDTYLFDYNIDAKPGFMEVEWYIEGNMCETCNGSSIDIDGLLTICAHEEAETIYVFLRAYHDHDIIDYVPVKIQSPPTVRSVKILQENVNIYRGGHSQFTYEFDDYDQGADTEVEWKITGNNDKSDTFISSTGELKVALGETAAAITVILEWVPDRTIRDTATVTVQSPISISISATGSIYAAPGGHLPFEATVNTVENIPDLSSNVLWEVTGVSQIAPGEFDNHTATLVLASGETAAALTITAKSVTLPDIVSNPVTINVVREIHFTTRTGGNWSLPGTAMALNTTDASFTYTYNHVAADTSFAFNLNGASGSRWFGPETDGADQNPVGTKTIEFIEGNTQRSWKLNANTTFDITVTPHLMEMVVYDTSVDQLETPAKPVLNNLGEAAWAASADVLGFVDYTIELLKDGNPVYTDNVDKNVTSYQFRALMRERGPGSYTVMIRANGNNIDARDSNFSPASDPQAVRQRTPVTVLSWNGVNAVWTAPVPPVGFDYTGMGYKVRLYRDEDFVIEYNTGSTTYNFTNGIASTNGSYQFRVYALGDENSLTMDSDLSIPSPADLKLHQLWLVDSRSNPPFSSPGSVMTKDGDKFTWNAGLDQAAFTETTSFRFSLSASTDDSLAPSADGSAVLGSAIPMSRSFSNNAPAWNVPAGSYVFTVEKAGSAWQLLVERPVEVKTGKIDEHEAFVQGLTYNFEAALTGTNTNDANIQWEVISGDVPPVTLHADTKFGEGANSHRLHIAEGETSKRLIIILYHIINETTKIELDRTAALPVREPPQYGNVTVDLKIQDIGAGLTLVLPDESERVISKTAGNSIIFNFTASGGQTNPVWLVSGKEIAGASLTLNAADYTEGRHSVRLRVTINGVIWSSGLIYFTVTR